MSSTIKTAPISSIANLSSQKGSDLTYKGLKIECIIRGMPPEEVLRADFFRLANFVQNNVLVRKDLSLLDEFDDYLDNELKVRNKPELIHNSLRLGYVKRDEEDIPVKVIKLKPEKKEPRQKDSNGLFKGTMKSYTYELQKKGKTVEQVLTKVIRKYPDAKAKSVKIWFNKSKKE